MNEYRTNGYTSRPGRVVTQAAGDVLEEVLSLAVLQAKLGMADFREARQHMIRSSATLAVGLAVVVGAAAVLIAAVGLMLHELAGWPQWASLLTSSGGALLLAALAMFWASRDFRGSMQAFERSQEQLQVNLQQIRSSLRRHEAPLETPSPVAPSQPR